MQEIIIYYLNLFIIISMENEKYCKWKIEIYNYYKNLYLYNYNNESSKYIALFFGNLFDFLH